MPNAIATELITTRIKELRGKKVMLDRDLAKLYGVPAKVLNQAVKRNTKRFPDDFYVSVILGGSRIFKVTNRDLKFKVTFCDLETRQKR